MSGLPYSEKTATKQQSTNLGVFHSAFIMSHLAMKSTPLKTSSAPNLNSTTTPLGTRSLAKYFRPDSKWCTAIKLSLQLSCQVGGGQRCLFKWSKPLLVTDIYNNKQITLFTQEERNLVSLFQELKHQRTQQGTWSRKVCVREKEEKTVVKRLPTLMWLVHSFS